MSPRIHRGRQGRVPVILVSGVEPGAMLSTALSLQLDLPNAVGVQHNIDVERQTLTRTVSDVTGLLEREVIDLAHACVSCAIREDIVPTLERLAASAQWSSIVACLPVAAEPVQVCRVLGFAPRNAPHVTIAAVVTALDGSMVGEDLLGDALLDERGLATSEDDRRGVAEVACAMVEYADLVVLSEEPDAEERALVRALIRHGVPTVSDPAVLDTAALVAGVHRHQASESWVAEVRREALPPLGELAAAGIWRLDLRSERPFHPIRFQDEVANLGGGPRRSRGCFWLPTRPADVCVWDCAGGQASVGSTMRWRRGERPVTRIVVTGLDEDGNEVADAFRRCLLTDEEIASRGEIWNESWDGLEPWLGPIAEVA